jgi:hypothetical protein
MIKAPANLKAIALPTEHGGWGFLLEPMLLGLLLAPSWAGFIFAMGIFFLFLVHQPLKIAVKDRLKGIHTNRSLWAEGFALLYASLALSCFMPLFWGISANVLLILGLMLPLMLVQAFYDFRNQSRELIPELAGAMALAFVASGIVLLAGWDFVPALMLWLLINARSIPAIIYVRELLRKQKGKASNPLLAYLAHGIALLLILGLALWDYLPYLSVLAMLILGLRVYLSMNSDKPIAAKIIGMREIGFGLMTVGLTALGFWWGI